MFFYKEQRRSKEIFFFTLKKQGAHEQFFRRVIICTANKNNVILGVRSSHVTYQIRCVWWHACAIACHSCPGLLWYSDISNGIMRK